MIQLSNTVETTKQETEAAEEIIKLDNMFILNEISSLLIV